MAHITTFGLGEFLQDVKSLGNDTEAMAEKMLKSGAEVAVEAWEEGIKNEVHNVVVKGGKGYESKRGYIDTGDMLDSVWYDIKRNRRAEVYPMGYDKKGVPNAEKAFVLNYGTSSYKGSRFVEGINEKADIEVPVAMAKVMDEYLKKNNL